MVVHEVIFDGKIKEICAVNGGSLGGNRINEKFIAVLKEILGADFVDMFSKKRPDQCLKLLLSFERGKKKISLDSKGIGR